MNMNWTAAWYFFSVMALVMAVVLLSKRRERAGKDGEIVNQSIFRPDCGPTPSSIQEKIRIARGGDIKNAFRAKTLAAQTRVGDEFLLLLTRIQRQFGRFDAWSIEDVSEATGPYRIKIFTLRDQSIETKDLTVQIDFAQRGGEVSFIDNGTGFTYDHAMPVDDARRFMRNILIPLIWPRARKVYVYPRV